MLLAAAGVPCDIIADLDEIKPKFETADVALIIGASEKRREKDRYAGGWWLVASG